MSGFEHFPMFIAKDACRGLRYLHNRTIVHRDLKPLNILVSNQACCKNEDPVAVTKEWKKCPINCKLTDFGESRSTFIQTNDAAKEKTMQLDRGTRIYDAPELILPLFSLGSGSQDDLKRADIWSLAMTLFILYNPDLPLPYSKEINANPSMTAQQVLKQNLTLKKPPQNSTTYDYMQASVSRILGDIIQKCLTWDPKDRPDINEVCLFLEEEREYISTNVPLRNSQNSALEKFDRLVACGQEATFPTNDGTNCCSFLSVAICDKLVNLRNPSDEHWVETFKTVIENSVNSLPKEVNLYRKTELFYDTL